MKYPLSFLLLLLPLVAGCQSDAPASTGNSSARASRMDLGPPMHPVQLVTALDKLAARDCPDEEEAAVQNWTRYTEWLTDVRGQVDSLREEYETARNTDPTATAPRPFSAYQPYIELQNRLSLQAAKFRPMSEALSALHDEVTRTLGNVR